MKTSPCKDLDKRLRTSFSTFQIVIPAKAGIQEIGCVAGFRLKTCRNDDDPKFQRTFVQALSFYSLALSAFPKLFLLALIALISFAQSKAYAGSPFYLTVEKSFSNNENPVIRLDYSNSAQPMLLRVLRPASLEKFLEGQLQISRSYEEPTTELNPGHYFVKGLNKVESPVRAFRNMLDLEFRKSFNKTAIHESVLPTLAEEVASPPEEIIHAPPSGFTMVREYYLDLQHGGKDMRDLGWWFSDAAWQEKEYKIRSISLDPLPDGVYLVQAVQGKTEAQCLMQVSSLSVQVKQSSEQLVVRVINRQLDPVSEASVSFRDGRGKWMELPQKTNTFGETFFSNKEGVLDGRLVIKAETTDKRQALVDTDFLPAATNDDAVFIVTDRPIFKPGETFFYKGIVRAQEDGELKTPKLSDNKAKIMLMRSDGAPEDIHADAAVTSFGSFSGSLDLDDLQIPGLYRLIAEIGGKPYGGEFRVRDYVKPVFYLELVERSPSVAPGEPFRVKFRAKRYSGGAPRDVKFEVFLYRKKFEAPQWVAEAGGGLSAGSDYQGEIRSTSALTEPKRIYSSVEERLAALSLGNAPNTWDSAPKMEESGEAAFEFRIPKMAQAKEEEWIYTLMLRAVDRAGSQAVLTENIYTTLSEAQPIVRFSKPVSQTGAKDADVQVRSVYPDGKPAPQASGMIDISLQKGLEKPETFAKLPFTTDDKGFSKLPLPELAKAGKLTAVATLETLGEKAMRRPAKSEPALMIVGGAQGDAVVANRDLELYTSSSILSPGEKAAVFALLPEGWGKSESGAIWETISGRKIFDVKPSSFKGRSRWLEVEARPEYGTGFYHTVTVPMKGGKYSEQTLGFRIVPLTKRLQIAVRPERSETEPLKPFKIDFEVKDSKGLPCPDTELVTTIVDRAVYAVQSELRPGVFDFFYPLPRLNLATFYSDELQGYGYADLLKKPNFKLGALKSQSKITKKSMRDTAGWFPHVVTDAQGRASITVDMPANVTEWLVTAIAADKAGRVGEITGGFRTVSDVAVEVMAPQFLRQGEEASILVKTTNQLPQDISLQAKVALSGEASLKEGMKEAQFTLEKNGEHLMPFVLEAKGEKGMATFNVALDSGGKARVGGAEEFEIPLKPAAMRQVFSGVQYKDALLTPLPEAGQIRELKIQVSSGLLGAALHAATALVSYPFGCTEQLVHGVIPNLVLMDLIKRAGITPEELGPLAQPLARAEKNASFGIKKIMQNQKTDGGFGLWPSDSSSSFPATLTALYALKIAVGLNVEGVTGSFDKGLEWISRRIEKGAPDQGGRALLGYELSRLAEIDAYPQPFEQQIAFVERVQKEAAPSLDDLIYALRIFVAFDGKDWFVFNEHFKDTPVKASLIGKLNKALESFDVEAYVKAVEKDAYFLSSFGFRFGAPYIVSSGLGVLQDLDALPAPLESKLKGVLLSLVRNGFWISTFDTAQVIFNSREILSKEASAHAEERKKRRISVRKSDGGELGALTPIPAGYAGFFSALGDLDDMRQLRLDGLAANEKAYCYIAVDVPYHAVRSESYGVEVARSLYRITASGKETLQPGQALRKGDIVVSEVRVKRAPIHDGRLLPSELLVIEDGIPSLARTVDNDEAYLADAGIQPKDDSYWSAVKETRRYPDKTVRIVRTSSNGETTAYQVWEAAFSGRAAVPPARAFDMYEESLEGNTEAQNIVSE